MPDVCVRFAPSPTGSLHIGGLRTALFNWLFARHHGGRFILRIEDTDQARRVDGAVENITEALAWYGLTIDAGPVFQSARLREYGKFAQTLVEQGSAYYCFCTSQRLDELRALQQANKQAPKYDGLCRSLSPADTQAKLAAGLPNVIRLKVPQQGVTEFTDMIYGQVSVENQNIDDQVLIKSDGFPTYHMANVVDDHEMCITHVIRAEEWLPSTPKHVLLYAALGWTLPQFAHLPMVIGTDRSKLSKRHGATAALAYRELGYLPEAVLNFIAMLGWNPKTDQEVFSLADLVKEFDLDKVNKSSAVFNVEKLDWLNGKYIRELSVQELTRRCLPFLKQSVAGERLEKIVALFQERMKKLSDITEWSSFFFEDQLSYESNLLIPKESDQAETAEALKKLEAEVRGYAEADFKIQILQEKLEGFASRAGLSRRLVLWPLRVAITGRAASPGVFEVMEILGQMSVLKRIATAISLLQKN